MTKADLVTEVSKRAELTKKEAEKVVEATFAAIGDALAEGDKFQLIGFGTFDVAERAARDGKNPRTNEPIHIEASKSVRFKAGSELKKMVNVKPLAKKANKRTKK